MQVEDAERRRNAAALLPIGRDTTAVELMVMSWFAAGHEVLWVPIIEVAPGRDEAARACADAKDIGEPRPLRTLADLASLPLGSKGWLLSAPPRNGYESDDLKAEWKRGCKRPKGRRAGGSESGRPCEAGSRRCMVKGSSDQVSD